MVYMDVSAASDTGGSQSNGQLSTSLSPAATPKRLVSGVEKIPTGIVGFDEIALGGIPKGRTTLISGTSGSGKTIFAVQFLVTGILKYGESGVFVTFEETPADIARNMMSFNWNLNAYVQKGRLAFLDASPSEDESIEVGEFDLGAFLSRLLYAVEKVNAKRISIDSISSLFSRYSDQAIIRRELFKIGSRLKKMGVTVIITGERLGEQDARAGRFGVEEFVSDNVILLHNLLDDEQGDRKRSVEILKFRGASHETRDTPMTVSFNGINVFPRPKLNYEYIEVPKERLSSGIEGFDEMLGGGVFFGSTTLISGPPGIGKTIMALKFLIEGAEKGESGLFFGFEENSEELYRIAESLGWDLRKYVYKGDIRLLCSLPEKIKPEEHYKRIKDIVDSISAKRFVLDSLSSLERVYSQQKFREFNIALNAYLKSKTITSFLTETTPFIDNGGSTHTHFSGAVDTVVLMKYVEIGNETRRVLSVLKQRGSNHDKKIRSISIEENGVTVGEPIDGVQNIIEGEK